MVVLLFELGESALRCVVAYRLALLVAGVAAHLQHPVVNIAGAPKRLRKLALLRLRGVAAIAICAMDLLDGPPVLEADRPAANVFCAPACELASSQRESPCIPGLVHKNRERRCAMPSSPGSLALRVRALGMLERDFPSSRLFNPVQTAPA